CARKEVNFASW
nr:immunoglobulin heavy chain junction region [Macaca mulatta]MOV50587.1 immunoglobulin heavy chain junction region [Macaca mulatta]MOV51392.1 immunoglobulin heavy chain junction region [Macaca mulatta]MOV51869.1 immunoglobulin heavy chain junction region [Macaca mulatta]MOV52219.1 immunoglobulin heavy chain junction region [Macaca mulatta]